MKIIRNGKAGAVGNNKFAYSFEIKAVDRSTLIASTEPYGLLKYETFGKYKVVPDKISIEIKQLFEDNGMAAGLTGRKTNLVWGDGPEIFKKQLTVDEKGKPKWERIIIQDAEIEDWLDSWKKNGGKQSWKEYIMNNLINFNSREICYSKVLLNRAGRVNGESRIQALENIPSIKCKMVYPETQAGIQTILVADWENVVIEEIKPIPAFDETNPFKNRVAVHWSYLPAYGIDFLPIPSFYSARNWIKLDSAMPILLQAFTDNSMSPKFHVIIPQSYIDKAEEALQNECRSSNPAKEYKAEMLETYLDESLIALANVLSGVENVGKFFQSRKFRDQYGEDKWEIIPIDQKVKDFIEAQLLIHKDAQYASTNAFQIPTALANISADGNLSAGAEILYSLKLFYATSTNIPEMIVFDALNKTLRANFPKAKTERIEIGFNREIIKREEDTTSKDRITNKV